MTEIMQERARYVIARGATLNNPHVPSGFFSKFDRITGEHAARLRSLVRDEEEPGDFDASLGRTRTGSVQEDALQKTMACLSSNVDSNVA